WMLTARPSGKGDDQSGLHSRTSGYCLQALTCTVRRLPYWVPSAVRKPSPGVPEYSVPAVVPPARRYWNPSTSAEPELMVTAFRRKSQVPCPLGNGPATLMPSTTPGAARGVAVTVADAVHP